MKGRKELLGKELIPDTMKLLFTHFKPTPDFIKKRIESLIEREYIRRSENNKNLFIYIP